MEYKHLIDTGVISRYYKEEIKLPTDVLLYGCISSVTKAELYNWLSNYKADERKRNKILTGIKNLKIIHFNENIPKLVEIYLDKNFHIKVPDTIIGITAIYYDLELHAGYKNDFDIFTRM